MLATSPMRFPICIWRSIYASYKLTGCPYPLTCIIYPGLALTVRKSDEVEISLKGRLIARPFMGAQGHSRVILSYASRLSINGDFEIGQNVLLCIGEKAELRIGGRLNSTGSGITSDGVIMVQQSLTIGHDVIIGWGCTITDSDWHEMKGSPLNMPVRIGNNVWLAHDVTVLKGAEIPDGCMVGAKSLVGARRFDRNSLIAGVPAKQIRSEISWHR